MKYGWMIWVLLLPSQAYAVVWEAVQGDVIEVHGEGAVEALECLGQKWPFKQVSEQQWQGWIAVDLKKKEGDYPLAWRSAEETHRDTLHVQAANFRISRITVEKKMANFDAEAVRQIRADQAAIRATYTMKVAMPLDLSAVIEPVHGIESTPFGAQRYVNGKPRSPHSGVDIAAPEGTAVLAPLAGQVLLVKPMFLNGNLIAIGHGHGLVSIYAHLHRFDVKQGAYVLSGQKIAEVGSSGRSTGAHLHWGVHFQGARVNPDSLLKLARK